MTSEKNLQETVEEMLSLAATRLPQDVEEALKYARKREKNPTAKNQIDTIIANLDVAKKKNKPICQDTGIPIFFVRIGKKLNIDFDIGDIIEKSVKNASENVPLRPNVVDPLSRENTGDNTGERHPLIHTKLTNREEFSIDLMLKGAGSENWSRLFMLKPTATEKDIINKISELLLDAGGQVCPPTIVGTGIGGTAEQAGLLAKMSLLSPLTKENKDNKLAELEEKITKSANNLGVGPMGLGGETTVLGTRILKAGCHTASLPLAVNLQCWAARRAKAQLKDGKLKIEVPK